MNHPVILWICVFLGVFETASAVGSCVLNPGECGVPTQHLTRATDHSGSGRKRVISGTPTTTRFFPWMVLIMRSGLDIVKCGGAILCNNIILTAAHCFDDGSTAFELYLYAGKDEIDYYNVHQAIYYVDRIIKHPQYDRNTMSNDIALLVTDTTMTFNSNVKPVCLPPAADSIPSDAHSCLFAGYGDTQGIGFDRRLNYVQLPLVDDSTCAQAVFYGDTYGQIRNMSFCAGHETGGPDGCVGDSGGPFVCQTGNESRYTVYGISSWGRGCGERHAPGVYTRVSRYREWINQQVAKTQDALLG